MTQPATTRAIVLAAGMGSRLQGTAEELPKPLRLVAGTPLLVRVLRNLQSAGIREAVVVLGHHGPLIRRALLAEPSLGLELRFVENPRYEAKNGVSLLAAESFIDRECLLTMADHIYSPELVRRLMAMPLPDGVSALAIDSDVERCFDIDDATKVRLEGRRITDIGKELPVYDALDTGVFRIGPGLVAALRDIVEARGDASLSEGVKTVAEAGRFVACNIGDARWIDVDTPAALERAEAMLRVFGESLGDEPGVGPSFALEPDGIEAFAPTWVRAARPYNEDHFAIANDRSDLLRLMSNESPFGPSERVLRAILDAATQGNFYPTSGERLKALLAEREGLGAPNVLLGVGSTELIDVVIRTFVAPGEEVLLSVPTFSMYETRTRLVGGIPVLVPMLTPTTGDHEHDIAAMIRAVTERTKLVFLCSPNNPTGGSLPEADLRRIVRLGLPTVIDEAYLELGGERGHAQLLKDFPNAVILRTFSKAYGLAGLRLGYALGHEAMIQLLARVKIPWNIPSITLAAATAALEEAAEFRARVAELRAAREELAGMLSAIPGLGVVPSEANFLLIDVSATGLKADELVAGVLSEGVLIRSLDVHHATKRFVRVTVGTRAQNARCARAFERVLRRHRPRARVDGLRLSASDAE